MSISKEWDEIWSSAIKLSEDFNDIVFIGGVAVYTHIINIKNDIGDFMIEFSHDVDAYISIPDYADLRDVYIATPNKRLNKTQVNIGDVEVDLYVEHSNNLAVPYVEIQANKTQYDTVSIACPEHLMILKLDAALDRFNSPKGAKDRRDIVKIAYVANIKGINFNLMTPYLTDERIKLMRDVEKSQAFMEITRGNAYMAKKLRSVYAEFIKELDKNLKSSNKPKI